MLIPHTKHRTPLLPRCDLEATSFRHAPIIPTCLIQGVGGFLGENPILCAASALMEQACLCMSTLPRRSFDAYTANGRLPSSNSTAELCSAGTSAAQLYRS